MTFPAPPGAVAAARTAARGTPAVPTPRRRRRPAEPAPLGSVLTAAAPALVRDGCPWCADPAVTHLNLTVAGAPVTFLSCSACGTRSWIAADGASLGLDEVLAAPHG